MHGLILSFFCGVLFLQLFSKLPNLLLVTAITIVLLWLLFALFRHCEQDARQSSKARDGNRREIAFFSFWSTAIHALSRFRHAYKRARGLRRVQVCNEGYLLGWGFRRKLFGVIIAFALGFLWILLKVHLLTSWALPQTLEGKSVIVIGYISSLPEQNTQYESFTFDTLSIDGKKQKTRLKLAWYVPKPDNDEKIENDKYPNITAGDKWQFAVKLKKPHSTFNPGGFDFEKYLFRQGIRAVGYVVPSPSNYLVSSNKYHACIHRARQYLRTKISEALNNLPLKGIITTLIIGDQSGISKEEWQTFRDTGTSYLMAISGLHISFIALLIFEVINFLWRRFPSLMLYLPARHAAVIFSFLASLFYSLLSGFSIPTQRALVMLAVFTLALLLRRNLKPWSILLLALFMVLLIDPLAVLAEGFWLSFVAVGLIIFVTKGRVKLKRSWWSNYCRIQWALTLGLAPFTLLLFQQASVISFAASILALPLVCLVIIPLGLIGSLVLVINFHYGGYLLWSAEKLMELVWLWLQWLTSFSWLNWLHPLFNWWIFVAAFVGIILLLAPRGFPGKWLGIICLLPLFYYTPNRPRYGEMWFTLLDVGQGLSAVIQTQNHVMVYDAGPKFLDSDAGETIVVPFVRSLGISVIDTMVISHGDDDHIGGAYSILSLLSINKIITSVPEKFYSKAEYCSSAANWQWDGVNFAFINPADNLFSSNDASCVLSVDNKVNSILLPGDIESVTEKWLVANKLTALPSTVLVAPHHGSRTSSSAKFVAAVNAKYVLFPIGYHNRFNFPAKIVLKRYLQKGAVLFDTAKFGAITFRLNRTVFSSEPILYRKTNSHYWNGV